MSKISIHSPQETTPIDRGRLRDIVRALLEEEVLQTVENPGDVADEIAYLMAIFSSGPGNADAQRGRGSV